MVVQLEREQVEGFEVEDDQSEAYFLPMKPRAKPAGTGKKKKKQIAQVTDCPVLAPELNVLLPEIYSALKAVKKREQGGHVGLVLGDNGPCITLRHLSAIAV